MIYLSASNLWRGEQCAGSMVIEPRAPSAHEDAEEGTAEHAIREAECPPDELAEVSVAVDVLTGEARILGQGLKRNYVDLKPSEIPGTMDRLKKEPTRVRIRDFKSGYGYMVAPPRENLQLIHNAIGAARAHGLGDATVEIDHLGTGEVEEATFDAMDLAEGLGRLRAIWEKAVAAAALVAVGKAPPVVTGDHCWRCEAYRHCPAQRDLAIAISNGSIARELPTLELTPEAVAAGWKVLKRAKKLLGEVEKIYRGYGSSELVPLGGGTWLGRHPVTTEKLEPRLARTVIIETYGKDVADAACDWDISKTSIEAALKPVVTDKKLKGEKVTMTGKEGLLPALLAKIDKAGGITRKTREVVEEFNPKKEADKKDEAA